MKRLVVGIAALLAAAGVAAAEPALTLQPSAAANCLAKPPGAEAGPEYPFRALKFGSTGQFTVSLTFTAPDVGPEVAFTIESASDEYRQDKQLDYAFADVTTITVPCVKIDIKP